jgi:DNA segregation ATPase FtsK/SpoIIIE-like protein
MKLNIKSFVVLLALIISSAIFPKQISAQPAEVNFQVFYDQLSPYGQWINYQNYGYVWLPDVGSDFVPYSTAGHWILTDDGWTWVSDYDWGWAPFHYGRWAFDNSYGWLWVPGNEWGPSWVNWRQADGYYGWSPMEPGISIVASFGRPYDSNNDHWMFVRDRDFERSDINRYYVNRTDHDRIIRNSTVIRTTNIDNTRHSTYVTGPARADLQRVTGRQIKPVSIRENSKPGQQLSNGQLQMYRPQMNKNNNSERKVAPSNITNIKDVKRPSDRSGTNQPRTATPTNNVKQQPNNSRPQNNSTAKPVQQQRTANPVDNNKQQQQIQQRQQQQAKPQQAQPQRQQQQAQPQQQQRQQQQAKPQQAQPQRQQQQAQPQQQQRQQQQTKPQQAQPQRQPQQAQPQQQQRQQQQAKPQQAQPQQQQQQAQPQQQPKESKPEQDKKRNE